MEEEKNNQKKNLKIPDWIKNPYIITLGIIVVVTAGYLLLPYMSSMKSPFTQYKPLPIDSTFIKLDTASTKVADTTTIDSSKVNKPSIQKVTKETTPADTSSISDLFKLNTDYQQLDPNQQLGKTIDEDPNDLFSQLILTDMPSEDIEKLQSIDLRFGIKPVLYILSSTAVEILAGDRMQYHLDILEAVEQSTSVQGIIITDKNQKVVYSTNKKYRNLYLSAVFPGRNLKTEKLSMEEVDNNQLIALPVHHQYGKIGMVVIIIED